MTKLREEVGEVRKKLANKDQESAESIKQSVDKLQKAALKPFETAYRKVSLTR